MTNSPPSTRLTVGSLEFNVIDTGAGARGSTVLLLHGFPDRALMWRHQIAALRDAGHRVIAPDLRGFGDSDRPSDVESYAAGALLGDVVGIIDALGVGTVRIGAHDWGAMLGWVLAAAMPDRVERLAAVSVGHPRAFAGAGFPQKQLSWYMLWWQFREAEAAMAADDWKWVRDWAYDGAERDSTAGMTRQLLDLERPGALESGLNWYRANIHAETYAAADNPAFAALPNVQCPTLGIWGDRDMALTERQMTDSRAFVDGPWRYERFEGIGHWIPEDAPDRLSSLLTEFFA